MLKDPFEKIETTEIALNPLHRAIALVLIGFQFILLVYSQLLLTHYHTMALPFVSSPSLTNASIDQPCHYLKNGVLYIGFWVQHILMASLKYKIAFFKQTKYFAVYDRYLFNIASGLSLWLIFAHAQPTGRILFSIPWYICMPLNVVGVMMLVISIKMLGGTILMPHSIQDIIFAPSIKIQPYQMKAPAEFALTTTGLYAYTRNPMQAGVLLYLIFGNPHYGIDRLIFVGVMILGIVIGVIMEENRMAKMYATYSNYKRKVKARFIPYLI